MKRSELQATGFVSFVICVTVLLWVVSSERPSLRGTNADESNQHQPAPNKYQPNSNQLGTAASPLVIAVVDGAPAQLGSKQAKYWTDNKPSDWWIIGLTSALLIVAGLQAYFFVRQLKLMKDALDHTAKNAQGAVDAAVATKAAVEAARASSERQLRAYVSADVKDISRFDTKTPPVFVFECINHGHTPAKDVEFRAIIEIAPNGPGSLPGLDSIPWNPRVMNLFPNANGGQIPCNCERVFTRQEIDQIRAGTHFLFIGLEIQYWDFVIGAGRKTRNYYRLRGHQVALRILTMEGGEIVEVSGLDERAQLPTFSVIPGCSLIT